MNANSNGTANGSTVEVTNIGPVERLSLPIPEGGGLVILKGRNGSGKSKTLSAVNRLLGGQSEALTPRDDYERGEISGFGVTLTVARSTTRKGELEVVTLEGMNAADFVQPPIKAAEAADAHRIRALISLAGVEPDASLFYPLLGGQAAFDKVCATAVKVDGDVVELAARVKRECEAAARNEEAQADTATGHAAAKREAGKGLDLEGPSDAGALQAALEAAIKHGAALNAKFDEAQKAHASAAEARTKLAAVETIDLVAAEQSERHAADLHQQAKDAVAKAEEHLRQSRKSEAEAQLLWNAAIDKRKAAEGQKRLISGWESAIQAAEGIAAPTEEERAAATDAVTDARQAVEQGALIRAARAAFEESVKFDEKATEHRAIAKRLREAAKATDEVLSDLVGKLGTALRVEAGRLVLKTKRGDTYFGELSHGERWKLAIDICIERVGAAGLLVMPQESYEGLDPHAREEIAEHARSRGVLIVTAEATDDEEITAAIAG